ncbi:MAG: FAD-binding protein [Chloroflexi bacterium]|nr:FAD-binding protein [Chloroflexota bacterium]
MTADVLIVGSGGAGVAGAIEAAGKGARVVVLEREAELGGAAAISGGGCCLVGTPLQRERGIVDSPDLAFADWVRFAGGAAEEEWARFYIEHTLHELYEWAQARGVSWVDLNQQEGNSVPRWHRPERGGAGLWHALHRAALSAGADTWLASTAATGLISDGGRIVGVRAQDLGAGKAVEFRATAVVMTTGGFASNLDMIYERCPHLREHRILEGSHVGARGEGHRIVENVGGVTTHMQELWLYMHSIPDYRDPRGRRGLVIRGIAEAIWVNSQGRRFHNESLSGGASGTPAVLRQEPAECWAILDSDMCQGVSVGDPYYYQEGSTNRDWAKVRTLLDESPDVRRSETLEGLSQQIGLPPGALVETVGRYNSSIEKGLKQDTDFGRLLAGLRPIARPPFYALHFCPLARKNLGGVKTNLRCQVLDKHYEPIPGLYAAGELAGMAGGHINGKAGLEGTMLGPSLFSGRVAGAWAARDAGCGTGFAGKPNRP